MKISLPRVAVLLSIALISTGCAATEPLPEPADTAAPVGNDQPAGFSQELHDLLPDDIKERGKIVFVGDPNAPFRIVEGDGSVSGFQTDLFEEFQTILGVEIEAEQVTGFPAVVLGLKSGRNDAALGPVGDTAETEKDFDFLVYSFARPTFLHRPDVSVASILDLCGRTVALIDGGIAMPRALTTIEEACATAGKELPERLPLPDANQTIMAVESGRADAAGMGAAAAGYAMLQQPGKYERYLSSPDEFNTDHVGMVVPVGNEQLRDALLGAWKTVVDNGVYVDLMTKYNMGELTVDEVLLNPATSS